jgi:hypothetical protein
MDANGNVYALSNGIIYPISQSIVNEAKEFVLNQRSGYMDYIKDTPTSNSKFMLPNFNINNLEYEWKKAQMYNFENIRSEKKIPIGDFVNLYGDNIYIFRKGKFEQIMETRFAVFFSEKIIRKNKMKIHSDNGILIIGNRYYLFTKFLKNQMRGSFTARWVKDFNNDGSYQFNEYEDKRRNFYENESFLIVARFTSPNQYSMKLSILNQLSGETVFSNKLENLGKEYDQGYFNINSFFFKPGIYSYYISFINTNTNEIMDNISDKFQILALNQTNEDKNITTPPINQDTEKSSSKEDMINELIQLLKDGKISEETFKASMKALEEK